MLHLALSSNYENLIQALILHIKSMSLKFIQS